MSSSTEWGKMDSDPSDIVEQLRSVDGTKDAGFVIDLCQEAAAEITRLRGLLRQAHGVIAHGPASELAWKYILDNIDDALNRPRVTEWEKMLAKKLAGSSE